MANGAGYVALGALVAAVLGGLLWLLGTKGQWDAAGVLGVSQLAALVGIGFALLALRPPA